MCRRPRSVAALLLLAVPIAVFGSATAVPSAHAAAAPVSVRAAFDRDATLGAPTALDVDLRLEQDRLTRAPLTEVRFAYPRSLGLVSSGLGLAACTRPPSDFAQVLIEGPRLGGCPPNAVMGLGTARATIRLVDGQVIPEYASVTLLSGPIENGRFGLVVYVDGERPFGAKLAFAGEVRDAPPPYGGSLTVRMPVIPDIEKVATVSLVQLRIVIGSHAIRYYGSRGAYSPEGVELPARCPQGGFRFRAQVSFADGVRAAAESATPCPRAVAPPRHHR